jgi:hypothetical protein
MEPDRYEMCARGRPGRARLKVTILGADYAVWEHAGVWSVTLDACPHRLAPLSQVRVAALRWQRCDGARGGGVRVCARRGRTGFAPLSKEGLRQGPRL